MRDELTLMELADRYLRGEMNATDRAAFEERMRSNAELRDVVEDQRALLGGMERLAFRPAVNKAYRSYTFGKWAPGIGGAAVIAILALGGWMLAKDSEHSTKKTKRVTEQDAPAKTLLNSLDTVSLADTLGSRLPAFDDPIRTNANGAMLVEKESEDVSAMAEVSSVSIAPGIGLTPMVFKVDPQVDTTMITPSGLVLDIPQGAFVDEAGRAITKPVRVTLLEAIDGVDIMKGGLSTMSGDTLLETGGMFYIDAQVDGKRVGIDPTKPLTVMVPSEQAAPRMMLYEGVMTEEGVVDWRNPKPLSRMLVPVDIKTLDFYPPGYLAKVAELGSDATDKAYTDSLYWSFSGRTTSSSLSEMTTKTGIRTAEPTVTIRVQGMKERKKDRRVESDLPVMAFNTGIDPAKVQTIWSERFNGSNLATREFEERMREIHRTCDDQVMDLYVNNLDKNLSQLDSIAVRMGHGAFASFALRNDGRVDLPAHAAERLRNVYVEWSQRYAEVARRTQEEFYQKETQADQQAFQRQIDRQMKDSQQDSERYNKEFNANLRSVYQQLGYPMPPPAPPRSAFAVPVTNPGWWNVDKAVLAATTSRSSMSYTDDRSGKTATLTYTPVTIEMADKDSFSELRVYLIPQELNSYQRVMETNGVFTEKLNALFQYDLVCMGRKNGQLYAASQKSIAAPGSITINMQPTDEETLRRMVHTPQMTASLVSDLVEQSRHLEWLELEAKRQQAKAKREEFRSALMAVVFPCWGEGVPAAEESPYPSH